MAEARGKELILYPCYFDARVERSRGRRVPSSQAVESPTIADLEKALKRLRIQYRVETKHHPSHWEKRGGRLVVTFDGRKSALIRKVASAIERRR